MNNQEEQYDPIPMADVESQRYLESLGFINIGNENSEFSVWRVPVKDGYDPFDLYIKPTKKCISLSELLYYARGDGVRIGSNKEKGRIFYELKQVIPDIIFDK